jgi:hypothetical protein
VDLMMPDWRNPQDYDFTSKLSADQWAWEFLRRNPRYREEWQAFISTWHALEQAYGKHGARDVQAWKRDPRASVPAEHCRGSDCRMEGDRVLIECALGVQWGFYKFPPDPADDDPLGGGRLVWRAEPLATRWLEQARDWPEDEGVAAIAFDLGLPLAPQLEQAKRRLQIEQRRRIGEGIIPAPRIEAHADRLCRLLRLLDADEAAADEMRMAKVMMIDIASCRASLSEAQALRDAGYRRLLLLK